MGETSRTGRCRRPVISVVIPTHNRPLWLRRAVDSALGQSFREIEVIVVDDGSTPPAELDALQDPRLRILHHDTPRGGAAARNTGVSAAQGEFIAFLDDDDLWLPTKLQRQLLAIGNSAAILCASIRESDGRLDRYFVADEIRLKDVKRGFVFGAGTSTILIRSDVMRRLGFDDSLPCNQDWDLLMRLVSAGRVRYLSEPLVVFNNGVHERITHGGRNQDEPEDSQRDRALLKHRETLGPFWFNYHLARRMLRDLRGRRDAVGRFGRAVRRCGVMPVAAVYGCRAMAQLARRGTPPAVNMEGNRDSG